MIMLGVVGLFVLFDHLANGEPSQAGPEKTCETCLHYDQPEVASFCAGSPCFGRSNWTPKKAMRPAGGAAAARSTKAPAKSGDGSTGPRRVSPSAASRAAEHKEPLGRPASEASRSPRSSNAGRGGRRCEGRTKTGSRCCNNAVKGHSYCRVHSGAASHRSDTATSEATAPVDDRVSEAIRCSLLRGACDKDILYGEVREGTRANRVQFNRVLKGMVADRLVRVTPRGNLRLIDGSEKSAPARSDWSGLDIGYMGRAEYSAWREIHDGLDRARAYESEHGPGEYKDYEDDMSGGASNAWNYHHNDDYDGEAYGDS